MNTVGTEQINDVVQCFNSNFKTDNELVISIGPGRVNLLGEHTDYNDGFVFPMAIAHRIVMAGSKRDDKILAAYSLDFSMKLEKDISGNPERDSSHSWINFILGVISEFQKRGHAVSGMSLAFGGNVPQSSGLSSSAALEVAAARLIKNLNNIEIDDVELVKLCQAAENNFVGVQCGIMDQFISNLGQNNMALLLDCRDYSYELVPVNLGDKSILIINTKKPRDLVESAYNTRRSECEQGVEILSQVNPGILALRDADMMSLTKAQSEMPENVYKRCWHVITENKRVIDAVQALKQNDLAAFGKFLYESHYSLKDYYEVSSKELDFIVEFAEKSPGILGARMTGAGFGGCVIALIENSHIDNFTRSLIPEYKKAIGYSCEISATKAEAGATDYIL